MDRAGAAHRQLVKQLDRLVQLAQQFQGGGHTQHLQYGGRGSIGGVVTQAAQVGQLPVDLSHHGAQVGVLGRVQVLEHVVVQDFDSVFQLVEGALETAAQTAAQRQSQRFIVLQHAVTPLSLI